MTKTKCFLFLVLLLCITVARGQNRQSDTDQSDKLNLGIGFGQEYGGIGGNVTFYPHPNLGVFGGFGWALAGAGYNAGLKIRFRPYSRLSPYLIGMYGYNAAVYVSNNTQFNKMFYGPTAGVGLDIGPHEPGKGCLSLSILIPARSADVERYRDNLRNNYNIDFKNNLLPITFSIGYKFIIL